MSTPAQLAIAFERAAALHGQGRMADAEALYKDILRNDPRHFDALHHLGVLAYQVGQFRVAADLIGRAIEISPKRAAFHSNHGLALQDLGDLNGAAASFDRAVALDPTFASAFVNRGNLLRLLGRHEDALASCEKAVALDPSYAGGHYNRGLALQALGRFAEAVASYDQALAVSPDYGDAHVNRGNALLAQNSFEEAVAAYTRALALDGTLAVAYANRGAAYQKMDRLDEALADFNQAIARDDTVADVYTCRGTVYKKLKRWDETLADYSRAAALEPDNFEAKKNLLWIHLWTFKDGGPLAASSADLARLTATRDAAKLNAARSVPAFRLAHDLEQIDHLAGEGIALEGAAEVKRLFEGREPSVLEDAEIVALARLRMNVHRPAAQPVQTSLNPDNDWAGIEGRYLAAKPEIVVIDNMLTPEALMELRRFCLHSTIWRTDYSNAYLGAFPEDGFVGPLHLQIASELRRALPRIVGDHPLEQLWAFKYTSNSGKGINIHADFARVNLNFWITPDEANLDPASGGMEIYNVPAPAEWDFNDYNGASSEKIYDFLRAHNAGSQVVPYRCNRAVLFNSNLFHRTSDIHFKDGYANRRINVTYLFGVGLKFP